MQFQILKLIIWPKDINFLPKVVSFETGKVNVITGASRTGKSAIIPIIDYCLASGDCSIPIDTIRDYTSWYGLIFKTATEEILIGRRVPIGNLVSNDFYLMRGSSIVVPTIIPNGNEKMEGIKHLLNGLSGVPYIGLNTDEENNGFQGRLSFRDLMAFVFQSQDIVANQNVLFYKTHSHEHREKLRNWFPFILGAENIEILNARNRLQEIQKNLNRLKRDFERAKDVSDNWVVNLKGHLKIAQEYGLLEQDLLDDMQPEDLVDNARELLDNLPEYSRTVSQNVIKANTELQELEEIENSLSIEIATAKKRLRDLGALKSGLYDYGNSVKRRRDRLHISQWLLASSIVDSQECPTCGSTSHPNKTHELIKISNAFKKLETESKAVAEVPMSFSREEEKLKASLEHLLERKKALEGRFDLLLARDKEAQEQFQQKKNLFLFLGHLKAHFEYYNKLSDGGDLKEEIDKLEQEYFSLLKIVDANGVRQRIDSATHRISALILSHLQFLDVEAKYKKIAPRFDVKDLNIQVLSSDDHWHYLAQVGSASNWVSFHIALMCALQEFFLNMKNSPVPTFVIFDQPSQVYFPKLRKTKNANDIHEVNYETEAKYDSDEDVEAVKNMFKTISHSIEASKGLWQVIILDHADDSIYGEIEGIYEVDVWRNGRKLIPAEWIENLPV